MSRSSSNASSFASVVEENEGEEEYDTGQVGGDPQRPLLMSQCKICSLTSNLPLKATVKQNLVCSLLLIITDQRTVPKSIYWLRHSLLAEPCLYSFVDGFFLGKSSK